METRVVTVFNSLPIEFATYHILGSHFSHWDERAYESRRARLIADWNRTIWKSGNIRYNLSFDLTGSRSNWTVSVLSSGLEAGGPAHGGAVGTGQGNSSGSGTAGVQSEDLYTLEAEITELQRENARVESQVLRLRSDITAMENQLKQGEKVSICSVGSIPCAE